MTEAASLAPSLAESNVLVLGIGILGGGQGVAKYLLSQGARVRASDSRPESDFGDEIAALRDLGCELRFGGHPLDDVDWADIVFRNPAVKQDSPVLTYARERGKRIEMEVKFFAGLCPAPLIFVTGSKGKTTTTRLLCQLLERGLSKRVLMAGNMGVSAVGMLDSITADDIALLEVSSFQLEEAPNGGWSPHIAVITNVGDDHLDRYNNSLNEYRQVKLSIAAGQRDGDYLVIPAWDDALVAATADTRASRILIGTDHTDAERSLWVSGERFMAAGFGPDVLDLGAVADFGLLGAHNATNFLFAAGAALAAGVSATSIRANVGALKSVEHRLEAIGTIGAITFIDDTTATAPMAVVAALEALPGASSVIICGGHDKGADFTPMVAAIAANAVAVVLLQGIGTDRFIDDLRSCVGPERIDVAESMHQAVALAMSRARQLSADFVLLSPGCASFGGFRNEFERAAQFRAAFKEFAKKL